MIIRSSFLQRTKTCIAATVRKKSNPRHGNTTMYASQHWELKTKAISRFVVLGKQFHWNLVLGSSFSLSPIARNLNVFQKHDTTYSIKTRFHATNEVCLTNLSSVVDCHSVWMFTCLKYVLLISCMK